MAGTVQFEKITKVYRTVFFGLDGIAKANGDSDGEDWVYVNNAERVTTSGGTTASDPACTIAHTKLYTAESSVAVDSDTSTVRSVEVYIDSTPNTDTIKCTTTNPDTVTEDDESDLSVVVGGVATAIELAAEDSIITKINESDALATATLVGDVIEVVSDNGEMLYIRGQSFTTVIANSKGTVERLAKITNDSTKTASDGYDVYVPTDKIANTDNTVNIDEFHIDVRNLLGQEIDIKIVFVCDYTEQ